MGEEIIENLESEQSPEINFDDYSSELSKYVDSVVDFHPAGITDPEIFQQVLDSESLATYENIPLHVSVEDAGSLLNSDRCLEIVHAHDPSALSNEVRFSLFPLDRLIEKTDEYRPAHDRPDANLYYFTEYEGMKDPDLSQTAGLKVIPLLNAKTHTTAALNLYQTVDVMRVDSHQSPTDLAGVVEEERVIVNEALAEGGRLQVRAGGNFTEKEESQLWELFSTRFQDISDNMPIRLEEDEESTKKYLFQNPAYVFTFTTTDEGKIDCCAFLTDRPEEYPWLSKEFIAERNGETLKEYGQQPYEIFVPGIASSRHTRRRASQAVLTKLSQMVAATNHPIGSVRFECTDVSSLYVPRLVQEAIMKNQQFKESSLQKLGQKNYVLVEVTARP